MSDTSDNRILLIKNGHIVDPSRQYDGIGHILIKDGLIFDLLKTLPESEADYEVIDAEGMYIFPGFVDLHVHFREPGFTYKENIATGSMAAAAGGFTTVCMMPNTNPVIDTREKVLEVKKIIEENAVVNVLPIAAITIGQKGEELTDFRGLREAGAIAVSEDGKSVMNEAKMYEALREARRALMLVMDHCEDIDLVKGGVMNEGRRSKALGLPGITCLAEESITKRDIALAMETRGRLHICHCSTIGALDLVRAGKHYMGNITAETAPHYLTLTEDDIPEDKGIYKMNPPLRRYKDRDALIDALSDGGIDCIATDHAPHSDEEKNRSFLQSPFGITGLETAFPVCYTDLVRPGKISLYNLIKCMTINPAKIIERKIGTLRIAQAADLTIVDLNEEFVIDPLKFKSMAHTSPYAGKKCFGKIKYTFVGGKKVYDSEID